MTMTLEMVMSTTGKITNDLNFDYSINNDNRNVAYDVNDDNHDGNGHDKYRNDK